MRECTPTLFQSRDVFEMMELCKEETDQITKELWVRGVGRDKEKLRDCNPGALVKW